MNIEARKIVLFIAISLDGFIAKDDGDIGFLSIVESPPEDYGYAAFMQTVDTVLLGRKTYDKVLTLVNGPLYPGKACYVISRSRRGKENNVTFYGGDPSDLIADLRKSRGQDIFIDGGAELVFHLMKKDLIDRYIVSVIPVLLGSGIRLFKTGRPEQSLNLIKVMSFPSGLVQMQYERVRGND